MLIETPQQVMLFMAGGERLSTVFDELFHIAGRNILESKIAHPPGERS